MALGNARKQIDQIAVVQLIIAAAIALISVGVAILAFFDPSPRAFGICIVASFAPIPIVIGLMQPLFEYLFPRHYKIAIASALLALLVIGMAITWNTEVSLLIPFLWALQFILYFVVRFAVYVADFVINWLGLQEKIIDHRIAPVSQSAPEKEQLYQ